MKNFTCFFKQKNISIIMVQGITKVTSKSPSQKVKSVIAKKGGLNDILILIARTITPKSNALQKQKALGKVNYFLIFF